MLDLFLIAALSLLSPDAPPASGTVTVALADPGDDDPADQGFADAVAQALGAASFTSLPTPGHTRYLAQVSVARRTRGLASVRVSPGQASAGVGSWGPSVRVPLGSRRTQLRDLVETRLDVRLLERAGGRQVWRGSAITVGVEGAALAGKLARAAIASYPQTLTTPVSVP